MDLDRGLLFESFGLVCEIVSDDPTLLEPSLRALPPGWSRTRERPVVRFGVTRGGVISIDGDEVAREDDVERTALRLGAVIRHHIAEHAPQHVFVHAGVVELAGCGIVIPGRSRSGKSTLVAELVKLGAIYCSDEYAVVDHDGMIRPFAKPLSPRAGVGPGFGEPVAVPRSQIAAGPVRCGLIVVTSYQPDSRWHPAVRSRGEGGLALLRNTVSARRRPGRALRAAGALARHAAVLEGTRGEAEEAAQALAERVTRRRVVGFQP